ncbi:hypothetical protein CLG96_03575 [Sphingomonas oleivorans]|uniref:Uncharacterized protein n=1 Tax=Sphingomonas oleivorans TaxID=1735121 RepID=A0A2T5G232_9SPHN|nr:hypothetical protein CLG96_03575 [Sphingomonas oleivorans]
MVSSDRNSVLPCERDEVTVDQVGGAGQLLREEPIGSGTVRIPKLLLQKGRDRRLDPKRKKA